MTTVLTFTTVLPAFADDATLSALTGPDQPATELSDKILQEDLRTVEQATKKQPTGAF